MHLKELSIPFGIYLAYHKSSPLSLLKILSIPFGIYQTLSSRGEKWRKKLFFQSLLGFILSCKIKELIFRKSFNPFWDLSRKMLELFDAFVYVNFQSLLGFIIYLYTFKFFKVFLILSIPFGIYRRLYLLVCNGVIIAFNPFWDLSW